MWITNGINARIGGNRLGVFWRGGVGTKFYVDSVNGDDANTGRSSDDAFETIATAMAAFDAEPGPSSLSLARGSYWREEIYVTSPNSIITSHGQLTDPLPTLDAADIVDGWTLHGASNSYSVSLDHAMTGSHIFRVWEDDVLMTYVADEATCESTAGSYTYVGSGTPRTIVIHPTGSTNPTSNGSIYEVTTRNFGVASDYDVPGVVIEGVHTTRNGHNDGSLVSYGENCTHRNSIASRGNKHCSLIWAVGGTQQNVVNYLIEQAETPDWTMTVGYHDDTGASGASVTFDGVYCRPYIEDADVTGPGSIGTGIYAHTGGGAEISTVTNTGATVYGCINGATCANTDSYEITEAWIEQCRRAIGGGTTIVATDVQVYSNNNDMGLNQSKFLNSGDSSTATLTDVVSGMGGVSQMLTTASGADIALTRAFVTGNLIGASSTANSITLTDSQLGLSSDYPYDDTSGTGNVWGTGSRGIIYDSVTYDDVGALQAAYPAFEVDSVEATLPHPDTVFAALELTSPAEASSDGRDCVPRVTRSAPDWATLMDAWDSWFLGIDGTGPSAVPAAAVTYNGNPVTIDGDYVIYS